MDFGVLIANWNGSGFVERCLGSVLAAARRVGDPMRILAVDDASTDDSPQKIRGLFPSVELLSLPKNVGFGRAVNAGMRALDTPWVFLLNNDLALPSDFFEKLIEARNSRQSIDAEQLFAIGAKTLEWQTQLPNHAGMRARWNGRMIVQDPFDSPEPSSADFIQGGSCLVDRSKFLSLGGFCEIFSPGYWEDYDICYQALKRGWKIYYEPRAVAYHWGKKSMRALLGDHRLALTIKRNHLLFNWINLTDSGLLRTHSISLGRLMLEHECHEIDRLASWPRALIEASAKIPAALQVRRERTGAERLPDRRILRID